MAYPESLSGCLDEIARFRKRESHAQNAERLAQQKDVIEFIQNTIDEGQKKIIMIQAPTGFGKSWIALALARQDKTSILTSTVDLQDQYKSEFAFLPVVKGKTRFPCKQHYEEKTCADGYCDNCELGRWEPHPMSSETSEQREQLFARVEPGTAGTFHERIIHGNHSKDLAGGTGIECYYYAALKEGALATSAVYNYASYLAPLKIKIANGPTREPDATKIPNRQFLICDEAHDYDHYVSNLDTIELDKKVNEELLGRNPVINPRDSQQDQTHQVHTFVMDLITEFQDRKLQYEKCVPHTLYLESIDHLKQHHELKCERGHGDGFTIKPRCRDIKELKGCTKLRAFIKEDEYLRCDKTCDQNKIENCGEDHSQINHEKYHKLGVYNSELIRLHELLVKQVDFNEEQLFADGHIVFKTNPVKLGSLNTAKFTNLLLNRHQITVFLSSTLNKEDFCKEIGIIPGSAQTLTEAQKKRIDDMVAYYDVPNLIPAANRKVWFLNLLYMSSKEKMYQDGTVVSDDPLEKDKNWKKIIMPAITSLLKNHDTERGIIMLTSYRQLNKIRDLQDDYLRNRLTFDVDDKGDPRPFPETKKKHLDQHCHMSKEFHDRSSSYITWVSRICKDEDCKKGDKIHNSVIVTVKASTGTNLEYDESRFQIILKAPYVSETRTGEDARADFIKKKDPERYHRKSAFRLVQFCGRSVRHVDDRAVTYVLDTACRYQYAHNRNILPKWFQPVKMSFNDMTCMGIDPQMQYSSEYLYDDDDT